MVTVLLAIGCNLLAQNTFKISKKSSVSLALNSIAFPGIPGREVADSSIWLNYTALVDPNETGYKITAELASGSIPEGMELYVRARPYIGLSMGHQGVPTGKIRIEHMPRAIIENIGTSYTGSGLYVGHQLVFTFEITDFSKIEPGLSSIYVQFTLTQ